MNGNDLLCHEPKKWGKYGKKKKEKKEKEISHIPKTRYEG